jgi:hypothetical protein
MSHRRGGFPAKSRLVGPDPSIKGSRPLESGDSTDG